MNFDVEEHLGATERSVSVMERDGQPARAVTLSRSYATSLEELWDAVTNSERLPGWFLPVGGELRPGGRYQLEGNAGGTITACGRPWHLALTWEFGGDVSWVEIRFSQSGADRARLKLTHTQRLSEHWSRYGPAATGVGWELGLLGLAFHLADPDAQKPDEVAFGASRDGNEFIRGSGEGWGQAAVEAGEDPDVAQAAARRTIAFYTGEPADSG